MSGRGTRGGGPPRVVVLVLANTLRDALAGGETGLDRDAVVRVYGVSPDTADEALRLLVRRGLARPRRRADRLPRGVVHVLGVGDRAFARQASRAERAALRLAWGEPVLVVVRADGRMEVHAADGAEVSAPGPDPAADRGEP